MASTSSSSTSDQNPSSDLIAQLSLKKLIMETTKDHLIISHFEEYHRLGGDVTPEMMEKAVKAWTNEKKSKQKEKDGNCIINDNRYATSNEMSHNSHAVLITGNNTTTGSITTADALPPHPIPTPVPAKTSRTWDIGSRTKDAFIFAAGVGAETVKACWQHATPQQMANADAVKTVAGVATGMAAILTKRYFW